MRKMMQIYVKNNLTYQIDRDTLEIYTLNGNFQLIAGMGGILGFAIAFLVIPVIAWFIEPIRPMFDLNFLTREISIAIVILTMIIHLLIGIFILEIGASRFVKKIFKMNNDKYEEMFSKGYKLLIQTERERWVLMKKSLWQIAYLVGVVTFAAIFLMPAMATAFINDFNLLTYLLFSILSLIFIVSIAGLTRSFFIILKISIKEGAFKKENKSQKSREEKKEAIKEHFNENPEIFLIVRVVAIILGFVLWVPLENILEGVGASEIVVGSVSLIYLILISLVLIVSLFVSYCPRCKWVPTIRIFLSLGSLGRPYTHYCRKCEKRGVETKCF